MPSLLILARRMCRWAFDFVVGIGLSQDAPDVSILVRLPTTIMLGKH